MSLHSSLVGHYRELAIMLRRMKQGWGALDKDPLVPKEGWQEARAKPLHLLPVVPGCQAVWVGGSYSWNLLPLFPEPSPPSLASTPSHQLSLCPNNSQLRLEPSFPCECWALTFAHSGPNTNPKQQNPHT